MRKQIFRTPCSLAGVDRASNHIHYTHFLRRCPAGVTFGTMLTLIDREDLPATLFGPPGHHVYLGCRFLGSAAVLSQDADTFSRRFRFLVHFVEVFFCHALLPKQSFSDSNIANSNTNQSSKISSGVMFSESQVYNSFRSSFLYFSCDSPTCCCRW